VRGLCRQPRTLPNGILQMRMLLGMEGLLSPSKRYFHLYDVIKDRDKWHVEKCGCVLEADVCGLQTAPGG